MVEAKKLLEQERARVLQEKTYPLRSRPDKEEDGQRRARLLLRKVGDSIAERVGSEPLPQPPLPRGRRLQMQESRLVQHPGPRAPADLEVSAGLSGIFKLDTDREMSSELSRASLSYCRSPVKAVLPILTSA
ncbi:hypothetical protein CB1_033709004 [Camelus ferus]|nr:hypothetical protein CB1_033709004 [Camelus ferus]